MANEHLSRNPHNLSGRVWYYEEPAGLEIIIKRYDMQPEKSEYEQLFIKWPSIRAALRRKDRARGK